MGLQRRTLIPVLAKSGPLEMPKLLTAFENDADPETGRQLVAALTDSAAAKGLRPEVLSPAIAKYPEDVRRLAEPLLEALLPRRRAAADAPGRAGARPRHRRPHPRPGDLLRHEGRLLDLPHHPGGRRPRRPGPQQDRVNPRPARPAGSGRLPQRQLRPRIRAGDRQAHRRRRPVRRHQPRNRGGHLPDHRPARGEAPAARHDRRFKAGDGLGHAAGIGHATDAGRSWRT